LGGASPSMLQSVGNLAINSAKSGVLEVLQGGSFGHGFRSAALGAIGMSLARGVVDRMTFGAADKAGKETANEEDGGRLRLLAPESKGRLTTALVMHDEQRLLKRVVLEYRRTIHRSWHLIPKLRVRGR